MPVIFSDLPEHVSRNKYAQAIERYAAQVRRRTVALYQVGTVAFPGLSDLDLLVVVSENHRDNNQFFSAMGRLPATFRSLFLHEPFIVPIASLEVMQHTSHHKAQLITGNDVLRQFRSLRTREERWCKVLESYCNFRVFFDQCDTRDHVSGRLAVAVASSMRYALADLDDLYSTSASLPYATEVDQRRAKLESGEAQQHELINEIWILFREAFLWLEGRILSAAGLEKAELLKAFAQQILRGQRGLSTLDQSAIARRSDLIESYNTALCRMHFSYGHLFFFAAYESLTKRYRQAPLERAFFSIRYRLSDGKLWESRERS